jgi:ribonuclease VapC
MVVDASAIMAIVKREPEWRVFIRTISRAAAPVISPVNWYEAAVNAEKYVPHDLRILEVMIKKLAIRIVPVDEGQMRLAHAAWRKYGKGRHQARLNMGDCFAYALAKHLDEPLLYKGRDFVHTDIRAAVP